MSMMFFFLAQMLCNYALKKRETKREFTCNTHKKNIQASFGEGTKILVKMELSLWSIFCEKCSREDNKKRSNSFFFLAAAAPFLFFSSCLL